MNINDITERYREDPQDARVLADRKVDVIINVASADQKPDMALFELIRKAVMNSKDQAVKRKLFYSQYSYFNFHTRHSDSDSGHQSPRPIHRARV